MKTLGEIVQETWGPKRAFCGGNLFQSGLLGNNLSKLDSRCRNVGEWHQQCCSKEQNKLVAGQKTTGRFETGDFHLEFFQGKGRKIIRKADAG
jgi:hypothetical protein